MNTHSRGSWVTPSKSTPEGLFTSIKDVGSKIVWSVKWRPGLAGEKEEPCHSWIKRYENLASPITDQFLQSSPSAPGIMGPLALFCQKLAPTPPPNLGAVPSAGPAVNQFCQESWRAESGSVFLLCTPWLTATLRSLYQLIKGWSPSHG